MSYLSYSATEIRAAVMAALQKETGLRNLASVGRVRGIGETQTLMLRRLYESFLVPVATQIDYRTATGQWLRLIALNAGIVPGKAQVARGTGVLRVTGGVTGTIAAGTAFTLGTYRFTIPAATTIADGGAVGVQAAETGPGPNTVTGEAALQTGVTLVLASGWLDFAGTAEESTEALRARIAAASALRAVDWPPARYAEAARLYAPLVRVLRTPRGPGSVTVLLARRGAAATTAMVTAAEKAIAPARWLARDVLVASATVRTVAVAVSYAGSAAADVRTGIEAWLRGRLVIAGALHASDVSSWPSIAGVTGLTVTAGAPAVAGATELLVAEVTATAT